MSEELIARLEKATEGSFELNCAVQNWFREQPDGYDCGDDEIPYWSGSIDAAMSLVPEGWPVVKLSNERNASFPDDNAHVELATEHWADPQAGQGRVVDGHAATLPLALCIAALRARATQEK
ncbi:MAG TPA: hypothetical protein VEA35_00625 [Ramlibacter sp.]|nr:hypothetical protein [Ramlibacter sp.]